MVLKYPQPDGRSIAPLKRSALKRGGPSVHFAELVVKRLIRSGFAARYALEGSAEPFEVRFLNALGPSLLFCETLARAAHIVARSQRVGVIVHDDLCTLDQAYTLDLRYGKRDAKPVAVKFVPLGPFTPL